MFEFLNPVGTAYAQEAVPAAPQGGLHSLLPLVIIFAIFYLLLILPQQKKQKKHQEMIDTLKTGDEVVTQGGIHGKITDVKAESFTIEIAPNTRIRITRGAVAQKVG